MNELKLRKKREKRLNLVVSFKLIFKKETNKSKLQKKRKNIESQCFAQVDCLGANELIKIEKKIEEK
jgi:hypothetical protein